MKRLKTFALMTVTVPFLALPLAGLAGDPPAGKPDPAVKPYTLNFCVVSGDKLGEMGKPYVFTNDNREIKFCCKSCLKDFNKEPAKYLKKIEQAEAKAQAAEKK